VYDSLLKRQRRELHRRAANYFANQGDPVLRAQQLDRAEDGEAARVYLAATQAQAAAYHYEVALRLVERGVALARDPADRSALMCLHGDLLHDLGAMPEARRVYEQALSLAVSDAERCRAWIGLAAVKRMTDDLDGAFAITGSETSLLGCCCSPVNRAFVDLQGLIRWQTFPNP
jgi:hypothetical protein